MLASFYSAECPGCFTPMAGSRCWLWAGSSVRVINCGHPMWPGFSKHGRWVPRGSISSTEFPGDPGGRNEVSYELTVEAPPHLFFIILLTKLVTLARILAIWECNFIIVKMFHGQTSLGKGPKILH